MSSINSTGASSSNAAAVYQEYLARLQAQRLAAKAGEAKQASPTVPAPSADTDSDGDSK